MGDSDKQNQMPKIPVPLDDFVTQIAQTAGEAGGEKAAKIVLSRHAENCEALKMLPDLKSQVEELKRCKESIRGWLGFLRHNWQTLLVAGLLLIAWFKGGGKLEPKQIDETVQQVQQLGKVLTPMSVKPKETKEVQETENTSVVGSAQTKVPEEKKYQVN